MIAIVDYGVGNLFSLKSSFAAIGHEATVSADAAEIRRADKLILPGVGAFRDAVRKLRESGLFPVVGYRGSSVDYCHKFGKCCIWFHFRSDTNKLFRKVRVWLDWFGYVHQCISPTFGYGI